MPDIYITSGKDGIHSENNRQGKKHLIRLPDIDRRPLTAGNLRIVQNQLDHRNRTGAWTVGKGQCAYRREYGSSGNPRLFRRSGFSDAVIGMQRIILRIYLKATIVDQYLTVCLQALGADFIRGEVYISGPESGANGAIDYESSAQITGGIVVAVGDSAMAMKTFSINQPIQRYLIFFITHMNRIASALYHSGAADHHGIETALR